MSGNQWAHVMWCRQKPASVSGSRALPFFSKGLCGKLKPHEEHVEGQRDHKLYQHRSQRAVKIRKIQRVKCPREAERGQHRRRIRVCLSLTALTHDSGHIQSHYCSSVKGPLGKNVPFHTQTLLHSETRVSHVAQEISTKHFHKSIVNTLSWSVGDIPPRVSAALGFPVPGPLASEVRVLKRGWYVLWSNPTWYAVFFVGDQFSGWVGKLYIKLSCPVPRTWRQLIASCEQFCDPLRFLSCDYVDCGFFHSLTGIFDLKNLGFCGQPALSWLVMFSVTLRTTLHLFA